MGRIHRSPAISQRGTVSAVDSSPQSPGLADILDHLDLSVLVVDCRGLIGFRNAQANRRFPEGQNLIDVFSGVRLLSAFEGWPAALERVFLYGEARRVLASLDEGGRGAASIVVLHLLPMPPAAPGTVEACLVQVVEQPRSETVDDQFEISKRLTALGKLASRVAHELNNPLDGVLRYVNLALRLADSGEPKLKSYLTESRVGLMRMVQIIGDLLESSRSFDGGLEGLTINGVVEEALRATACRAEEHHIVIAVDFQSLAMPQVHGSRIYQVCCNLIKNAIDAMPNGGRLSVTTGIVHEEVVIRVADTGIGLPQDPSRLFEPFYTTKPPGKGTGLGLAICKDFVEDMKGTISASPAEEHGAVFTVRIPLSSFAAPPAMPLQAQAAEAPRDDESFAVEKGSKTDA